MRASNSPGIVQILCKGKRVSADDKLKPLLDLVKVGGEISNFFEEDLKAFKML